MNYNVISVPGFEKQAKRLTKKFPSLKREIDELISSLELEPDQGTPIGNHCFKIRMAIASKGKGKGKSGGARVITHIYVSKLSVFLLSIYDKSEKQNLSNNELLELLSQLKK